MNKTIKYISAFTGAGKTYGTCNVLSQSSLPFIYAVPTKVQVEEVKASYLEACKRNGTTPNELLVIGEVEEKIVIVNGEELTEVVPSQGRINDLIQAVSNNVSVICTHNCFIGVEEKALNGIHNFTIILDEVNTLVRPISISKFDYEMMLNANVISVNQSTGALTWISNATEEDTKDSVITKIHPYIVRLIKDSRVYKAEQFYVEEVPHRIFNEAKEVLVLAYMFDSTYMYHHFNALGFEFKDLTTGFYTTARYQEAELKAMAKARLVVKVSRVEPMNASFTGWTKATAHTLNKLTKAVESVRRKSNISYENCIYTCPKQMVEDGSIKFGKAEWVYSGARGTEKYIDKTGVLVLLDKNMSPAINSRINQIKPTKFTKQLKDAYALQEMIQFIWRSNIRDIKSDKPVTIYFASHRMAKLFNAWLNN